MPPDNSRQLTFAQTFPRARRYSARPTAPVVYRRRPARPHQLGIGGDGWSRVDRCPSCAHELAGRRDCVECGAFTCAGCDGMTSANGGDGTHCARCAL